MRVTPYRIVITSTPEPKIIPGYMEKLGPRIVSYISEMEYKKQYERHPLFFTCPYTGATGYIDTLWLSHGYYASNNELLSILDHKIEECSMFYRPRVIIVNPITWKSVIDFVCNSTTIKFDKVSTYNGLEIRRSEDIPEKQFEIY